MTTISDQTKLVSDNLPIYYCTSLPQYTFTYYIHSISFILHLQYCNVIQLQCTQSE